MSRIVAMVLLVATAVGSGCHFLTAGMRADAVERDVVEAMNAEQDTRALDKAEELLALRKEMWGVDDLRLVPVLTLLGMIYQKRENFELSVGYLEHALRLLDSGPGEFADYTDNVLFGLGVAYFRTGKPEASLRVMERCLAFQEARHGKQHVKVAPPLMVLGNIHLEGNRPVKAREVLSRAVTILKVNREADDERLGHALRQLAQAEMATDGFDSALNHAQEALTALQRSRTARHEDMAAVGDLVGDIERMLARYKDAQASYEKASRLRKKMDGDDSVGEAGTLIRLARLFQDRGMYKESLDRLDEAMTLVDVRSARTSWVGAEVREARADVLVRLARYKEARDQLTQAVEIREDESGETKYRLADTLDELAHLQRMSGELDAAAATYQRAREIREQSKHPSAIVVSLHHQARLEETRGNRSKARFLHEQAVQLREKHDAGRTLLLVNSRAALSRFHLGMAQLVEAETLGIKVLSDAERVLGPQHPDIAWHLDHVTRVFRERGRLAGARSMAERSLAIRERALGADHPLVAESLVGLGMVLRSLGSGADARARFEQAVAILEKSLGPEHPDVAEALQLLALSHEHAGNLDEARAVYERALASQEALAKREGMEQGVADSLEWLGDLLQGMHERDKARTMLLRALKIREAFHPDGLGVASCLDYVAEMDRGSGDVASARSRLERALSIRERVLGSGHPAVASALFRLADLDEEQGSLTAATERIARASTIQQDVYGPTHANNAAGLMRLAHVEELEGDQTAARAQLEKAVSLLENALGPHHPDVGAPLVALGLSCLRNHEYEKAKSLLQRALPMRRAEVVTGHPSLAVILLGLAHAQRDLGEHDAAAPLYEEALQIRQQTFGPDRPQVMEVLEGQITSLMMQKRHADAVKPLERVMLILQGTLGAEHVATAQTQLRLGNALLNSGEGTRARPLLQQALETGRARKDKELEWRALAGLASEREAAGELTQCIMLQEQAVRLLTQMASLRPDMASRVAFLAAEERGQAFESLARVMLLQHQKQPRKGWDAKAEKVLKALREPPSAEELPKPAQARKGKR